MNWIKKNKGEDLCEKQKKKNRQKKGIALCLILLFFVFTVTQLKLYKDEILPVKGNKIGEVTESVWLFDGVKINQEMTVKDSTENYLDVDLKNAALRGNEGAVYFSVYDQEENLIFRTKQRAGQLEKKQKYRFLIDAKLEPGKVYCLSVETRQMTQDKAVELTLTKEKSAFFSNLTINGQEKEDGQRLRIRLMHPGWNMKKIAVMIAAFLFAAGIVMFPVQFSDSVNRILSRLLFLVTPLACYVIVEKTCQYRMFSMKQPAMILNLWIYLLILLLVYLILNRTKLACIITACFSYGMALINYFVSVYRGTVFVPADITAAGTAVNVLGNYSLVLTTSVLWGGIGLMMFLVCWSKLENYQGMKLTGKLLSIGGYALMIIAFINIFYQTNSLEEWKVHYKVWNPAISYKKNGFAVGFVVGSRYLIPQKPDGYSVKDTKEKAEPYIEMAQKEAKKKQEGSQSPNIIAIMNEAFSDLSYDGELAVSEDYMPFIRNLKENTIKGNLHVTPFGGRTANTEYEFLTGMSMAFFPGGTVPYEHQLRHETFSLTTQLKEQNYTGLIALHPFIPNGYNRENAYPLLGFEQYYSRDIFQNPKKLRKYISDEADFEKIIELYEDSKKESDAPFYLFNVTMQNHGGYGEDFDNLPLEITILDDHKNESAERYLNLVKKSDEAFELLLDYFKEKEDPTVIVMFGDHQPNLSDEFFASLIGEDKVGTLEGSAKEHVVPFVIWANYDIQEEEIENLSVNYLSTKVIETAGLEKTPFQCFLSEMEKEVPVITGNYYIGNDGVIRELSDTKKYQKWIETYHSFQYNQVYDYNNIITKMFQSP